jgi:hypothetical protein
VSGRSSTTANFTLQAPTPPPNGTKISGVGQVATEAGEIPEINWGIEAPITTKACAKGHVTVTITARNTQTQVIETTSPVTLTESPANSGTFSGKLPAVYPIHGEGTLTISATGCPDPSEDEAIEMTIYIDPSGVVVDGDDADAPLPGATVTLLASETRFRAGPYLVVPNGSAVMSPANRVNPGTTNASGEFGWETSHGYYEVEASDSGCGNARTAAFKVPPPVDDLRLVLYCVLRIDTESLPEATLGVPYATKLAASGVSAPFKWKKIGKLPKGLKLNAKTGELSGTMKASKVSAGTYTVRIQVTDHKKRKRAVALKLKVG